MTGVNLIPAYRSDTRKRRRRLRRWAALCLGYCVLLGAAYGLCDALFGSDHRALAGEFGKAAQQIAKANRQIQGLQKELAENERLLSANRALADQPDWSLLLAVLAKTLGDQVVLKSCEVKPAWIGPGSAATLVPAASQATSFVLAVRGFGRSQAAVTQFVLRLERTELFKEVKLIKINRESFVTAEAVAFQLEALLEAHQGKLR